VITEPPIDPAQFVACVQPLLAGMDLQGLSDLLRSRFTEAQLAELFQCDDPDARKVAALAFGLVGCKAGMCKLAPLLKDRDPMVNQMAEHAMWTIWFRSGATPEANRELCRGTKAMNRREFDVAVEHFARAIAADPSFAEAYNQRAIVMYLQERYEESIEDCKRTVERMPHHFGAWAGMGHCHAHLGRLEEAVACYEKVLSIHPSFGGVPQVVEELRHKLEHGET
jgi:tetratricopeptide (TPR) repeat protein